MIKLSIIIPIYNVYKYLEKCLESLVNQTLKEIQIIVVNDGSPDNSQDIIDKYSKLYPNKIISITKENGGQGSARNLGLDYATGEYIAYVDGDDYVELNMFELLYNEAKSKDSDIVVCGLNVIDTNYDIIKKELPTTFNNKELDVLFGKIAVWNKIYKKSILLENQIKFREKLWYEDLDFTLKIVLQNYKIDFIDECLYNYLLRPGSTMNNSNIQRNLELISAFEEVIKFCKNNNHYEKVKEKLEILCIDHLYISAITRVINADADKENKKQVIDEFLKYTNEKFPDFRNNKYMKYLSKNRRLIFKLISKKKFFLVKLIFKIKNI